MPASDASAELLMAKRYVKVSLNHCFCTWIGVPACEQIKHAERENAKRRSVQACIKKIGQTGNAGHGPFLPEPLCVTAHAVSRATPRRAARTWVGVRDEDPGRDVTRCVGAELV